MSQQLACAIVGLHPDLKQVYADTWLTSGDIHREAEELVGILLDGGSGVARFGHVIVSRHNYTSTLYMDDYQAAYLDQHPDLFEEMKQRPDDIFGKLPPRKVPAPPPS
jgi:hypothetical protein